MTERIDSKKKKSQTAETPVHALHAGSVAALIWRRQSPAGYVYFDYSLTRSWQSLSSGSRGQSRNFFAQNERELLTVVQQASNWIAENERSLASAANPE
ncbi:MAG: hypothetical protein SFX18_17630 [Pirellulales bacterium]|nr:hypothetical protein [Pirellulales bacterium]